MEILDINQKELDKLRDLLKKAKISKYFDVFVQKGVYRVKDLQDYVKDELLIEISMSQPERERFWKYVNQSRPPWWTIKRMFRKPEVPSPIYDEIGAVSIVPFSEGAKLISHKELVELGVIGKGTFGEVSRGMWHYKTTMPPKPVAVKIVSAVREGNRDQIMREAEVWNRLEHENIIKLYGVTFTKPFKMIMELAIKGSLDKYLRNKVNQMLVEKMWHFSHQIASGMEYLHSKRIIHRDLACRNVLMISDNQIKISDFGMTRFLPNEDEVMQTLTPHKVPFAWTSLEVLEKGEYSNASDVWSFAVTMWEIYSYCVKPWEDLTMLQVTKQLIINKRLQPPTLASDEIFELMTVCWMNDPTDRPCFGQILAQLKKAKPQVVMAKTDSPSNLDEDQCVPYKKNHFISIIDKQLKEHWTGQNQENFKTGYILSSDMETDPKKIEAYKRINFKRKPRVVEMNPPPLANYLNIELFQPSREKVNSCEYEDLEQPKPTQPATKLYLNSDSSNEDPIYDVCSSSEDLDCPEDDPYDDPYDAPICMTQSVGERSTPIHPSVELVDRLKIGDSYAYTTMMPGGISGISGRNRNVDRGFCRDLKEMDKFQDREQDEEKEFDPYVIYEGGPKGTPVIPCDDTTTTTTTAITTTTTTEITETTTPFPYANSNSFFDEPILSDSALTLDQLKRRNRASLCRGNMAPGLLEDPAQIPATRKPLVPPKPSDINRMKLGPKRKTTSSKPLNISTLSAEFPEVPESEILVILDMFNGSVKEARKDLKFKLFREEMQGEIPMLTSVRCYDIFKECDYNNETAKKELLDNPLLSPRGKEEYEWLN